MQNTRGFSFVEMLVLVGIVVALAGLVVPMVSMNTVDDQWEQVNSDLNKIKRGIEGYTQSTRAFPVGHSGACTFHYLFTDGIRPANNVLASGPEAPLSLFLQNPNMTRSGWSGPYAGHDIGADPWGRSYLVNVNGYYNSLENVLVLCAGPNGQVNTPPSATTAWGDDVILVVN